MQFVRETKDPTRIGVLTTLQRRQEFVTYANVMLRETRVFAWDRDWVNTQNNKTRTTLYEQLSFFWYTFSAPENHFQREKFAISGRAAGRCAPARPVRVSSSRGQILRLSMHTGVFSIYPHFLVRVSNLHLRASTFTRNIAKWVICGESV